MRPRRLERLWAMIEKHVESFGTFQEGARQQRQSGVLRINCIDCLDRTNVVQGWLARKQLDKLLTQLGLLTPGSSIKDTFPEVQEPFRCFMRYTVCLSLGKCVRIQPSDMQGLKVLIR